MIQQITTTILICSVDLPHTTYMAEQKMIITVVTGILHSGDLSCAVASSTAGFGTGVHLMTTTVYTFSMSSSYIHHLSFSSSVVPGSLAAT